QAGKAREIAVGRAERHAVFDRERSEMRVTDEWSSYLTPIEKISQDHPVTRGRAQHIDVRPREPFRRDRGHFAHRARMSERAKVGGDAKKYQDRRPGKSNGVGARHRCLKPGSRARMLASPDVV